LAVEESVPDQVTFSPTDPSASAIAAELTAIKGRIDALVQSTIEEPAPEYFRLPPLHSRRVKVRVRNRGEGKIRLILEDNP
jgi:hypothetical protein